MAGNERSGNRSAQRVGNRSAQRGRKLRRRVELTPAASRKLRQIWEVRRQADPEMTEDDIVCAMLLALPEPASRGDQQ